MDRLEFRLFGLRPRSQDYDIGHHLRGKGVFLSGWLMEVIHRSIQNRVLEGRTDLLLMELVHKDEQTHRLHLRNVFIQVLIEEAFVHGG